jgi:hypothetical protein
MAVLYFRDRYQNQRTMGFFIFIDYLIGLIVLIRIHAPWWAWTIYVVSVLVWLVIGVMGGGGGIGSDNKTTDGPKQE